MGALMLLVLAADLAPPPPTAPETWKAAPPALQLRQQDPGAWARTPEVEGAPQWDPGPQISVSVLQSLNGIYLGLAACGAVGCYYASSMPVLFGMAGAAAGFGLSLLDREPARDWGRASLLDSAIVGASLLSLLVATQPALSLGPTLGYTVIFLTDAALIGGAMLAASHVSPRPETVLLADTLGIWGLVLGGTTAGLLHSFNPANYLLAGAAAGVATGALMGFSAPRMTLWRVLAANGVAMLGALLLGGGLTLYETLAASPQRPYEPAVPVAGVAAGIAGGFLVGFVLSDSL